MGGHTLNLDGHEIRVTSTAKEVVKFKNGKITNGTLKIYVPNGDIEFSNTDIDETVTYDLEAASETIRFSNAVIKGKCNVKSNTRVSVEYSEVSDISFAGSGILSAGNGAKLGSVTVSDQSAGATLNIAPTASVDRVELNATANVEVSGTVLNIAVKDTAKGSSLVLNQTADVTTVAVNAANTSIKSNNATVANVYVSGGVANSLKTDGIKATTATKDEMDKYLSHLHMLKLVSETKATCEDDGEAVYACECGEQRIEKTPATGHKLTITGKYITGSSSCSEGITVTIKCEKCTYLETKTQKDHYYLGADKKLITQCDKEDNDFHSLECVVCHHKDVNYELNTSVHTLTSESKSILSDADYDKYVKDNGVEDAQKYNIKLSDLSAHELDTTGFYYGYVYFRHCAICGINVNEYYYYTHTDADGCLYHKAYYADYKGNDYFEAFDVTGHGCEEGHRYLWTDNVDYASVSDGIAEITSDNKVKNEEILFEPETAYYCYYQCGGCGLTDEKRIYLSKAATSDYFRLDIEYKEDGKTIDTWDYRYDYSEEMMLDRIKNVYGLNVEFGTVDPYGNYYTSGNITRSMGDTDITEHMERRDKDVEFRLDRNGNSLTVDLYKIKECSVVLSYYTYDGATWNLTNSDNSVRHTMTQIYGENCIEDGKGCIYCGEPGEPMHDFYSDHYGEHPIYSQLITGDITGFNAADVYNSGICRDCNTYINAEIILGADWTLNSDVYIKAEGVTIDLNGYDIDLNGHSLIIYSYVGRQIILTDSTFDTANPNSYNSAVRNSGSSGVLALVRSSYYGEADVIFGTVAIECDMAASEETDRYGVYDWLLSEGYDVPIAMAGKILPDQNNG